MTEAKKLVKEPMTFTRNQALLLGIASLLPCCWVFLFYGAFMFARQSEPAPGIMPGLAVIMLTLPYLYTLALIIFYIVLISRETDLTSNRKYSWGWIVFFANIMAFPLVWYKFVWSKLDQPDRPPAVETPVASGRKKAIWLGVVSWAPICMIILGIAVMVLAGQAVRSPEVMISIILCSFIVIGIISISLTVYFCILISKDQELTSEQKHNGYWAIFLLNFWAFPWAWHKFVWKKLKEPVDARAVKIIATEGGETDD